MVCEKKRKLLQSYQQATRKYSDAVAELAQKIGMSSKINYDALYRLTEALRIDAAEVKQDLETHIAEHH